MFQGIIGALLLIGVFQLIDRKNENKIDPWETVVIVVAPALIVWGIGVFASATELPNWVSLAANLCFIIIPYFILTEQYKFPRKQACVYTAFVPVAIIASQYILFALIVVMNQV